MGWLRSEDEQKKWENSGDEHFIKLTLSCKKCIFNLILAKSQNLPTGSWDYQNSLLGQDVFSLWGAFIPQKCTKRRESGFHYRITINLLHPLLQLSAINTFYQICVFFFLFMKGTIHEKGSSSTSSCEDNDFPHDVKMIQLIHISKG